MAGARLRSLGRKSDYACGWKNQVLAEIWDISPGRTTHTWEWFCKRLKAMAKYDDHATFKLVQHLANEPDKMPPAELDLRQRLATGTADRAEVRK